MFLQARKSIRLFELSRKEDCAKRRGCYLRNNGIRAPRSIIQVVDEMQEGFTVDLTVYPTLGPGECYAVHFVLGGAK